MSVTELSISQLGPKGDGIHFGPQGRVFVERSLPGDRIKASLRKDRQGIVRGEIVEILEPSQERQPAPCVHYDKCGNCTLQHMGMDSYRQWKIALVRDALKKQGLKPTHWMDPVFVGAGNRRRATLSALKKGNKISLGYYRRRSQEIVDIESCLVSDSKILEVRQALLPLLKSVLVESSPVDFFVQRVGKAVDVVVTGVVGQPSDSEEKLKQIFQEFAEQAGVTRVSWRRTERDLPLQVVYRGPVLASFGMLQVGLPAAAFLQPTVEGEKALVQAVLRALPLRADSSARLADLFSGCGTFSGPMLERGSVDAYESLPLPVAALARAASVFPLRVYRRDLFTHPLRPQELNRYDAVVMDPPRAGCPEQATQLARARTPLVVSVSCNPATFARDARTLCQGGYRLKSIQMVDQFLWSHHVEVVGVFEK